MRKLATVQRIEWVRPIVGADKIELVGCEGLGWQCVAKRGEFSPGDLCIYFECESVLPEKPEWEFLRQSKFRLKTRRFMGEISQGMCWPLAGLPGDTPVAADTEVDTDVSEILGVVRYEPAPVRNSRGQIVTRTAGNFPSLIPKTDETRIQSAKAALAEWIGIDVVATVKLDGQSITFACMPDGEHLVCTRNFAVKDEAGGANFWAYFRSRGLDSSLPSGFAIQGEWVGPGVQNNRLGLVANGFYAYQVYSIDRAGYLDHEDFLRFCGERGIRTVPEWARFTIDESTSVESLLALANATYPNGFPMEGIVVRPLRESEHVGPITRRKLGRSSFKVINNEFLLRIGE